MLRCGQGYLHSCRRNDAPDIRHHRLGKDFVDESMIANKSNLNNQKLNYEFTQYDIRDHKELISNPFECNKIGIRHILKKRFVLN